MWTLHTLCGRMFDVSSSRRHRTMKQFRRRTNRLHVHRTFRAITGKFHVLQTTTHAIAEYERCIRTIHDGATMWFQCFDGWRRTKVDHRRWEIIQKSSHLFSHWKRNERKRKIEIDDLRKRTNCWCAIPHRRNFVLWIAFVVRSMCWALSMAMVIWIVRFPINSPTIRRRDYWCSAHWWPRVPLPNCVDRTSGNRVDWQRSKNNAN